MLAKVVSSPTTSRGETLSSPMASPEMTRAQYTNATYFPERPTVWRSESERYVRQYRQQGQHIPPLTQG
jgi:hypothetical protein